MTSDFRPFSIQCMHCSRKLAGNKEQLVGKRVKCPACHEPVLILEPTPSIQPTSEEAASPEPKTSDFPELDEDLSSSKAEAEVWTEITRPLGMGISAIGLVFSLIVLGIPLIMAMLSFQTIYTSPVLGGLGVSVFFIGLLMICGFTFLKDENNLSIVELTLGMLAIAASILVYMKYGELIESFDYREPGRSRYFEKWVYRGN